MPLMFQNTSFTQLQYLVCVFVVFEFALFYGLNQFNESIVLMI